MFSGSPTLYKKKKKNDVCNVLYFKVRFALCGLALKNRVVWIKDETARDLCERFDLDPQMFLFSLIGLY